MVSIIARARRAALNMQRKIEGARSILLQWPGSWTPLPSLDPDAARPFSIQLSWVKQGSTIWNADGPFPFSRVGEQTVDFLVPKRELIYEDINKNAHFAEPVQDCEFLIPFEDGTYGRYRVFPASDFDQLWQPVDREAQSEIRVFTKYKGLF